MPAVEIDEVELLRLRKQDQTIHHLMGNPKAKRKVFEAFKEADPNAKIPELEIEEAAKAPVAELQNQVAALTKTIEEDRAEREKTAKLNQLGAKIDADIADLRRKGWTDEGIASVRKMMDEKGIMDVQIVADHYEKQHPPAEPVNSRTSGVGGWDFTSQVKDEEVFLKGLLDSKGNNEALVDREARAAVQDFRQATRGAR